MPFPRKKILAVLWILNALLWSFSLLVWWCLTQLQVLSWLALLPNGLAQIALALYASPIVLLAACLLAAGISLWLCWRGVPGWVMPIPALLLLALGLMEGRIDTQGTSRYVFSAAERGDLKRTREQLLIHMARYGLPNEIQALLQAGTDVNAKDPSGGSALSWASDPAIVKVLLQAGAVPDRATLVKTAFWGQLDILKLLFQATPDGGRALASIAGDEALLTVASVSTGSNADRAAIVRMLILRGANPNAKDSDNETALMHTSTQRYPEVAQVLLQAGADPNAQNRAGETALHQAFFYGIGDGKAIQIVKVLLQEGANVNLKDAQGSTPLHSALKGLQEVESSRRATPSDQKFYDAIQQERIAMIRLLVEAGANPNIADRKGQTALKLAKNNREVLSILQKAR